MKVTEVTACFLIGLEALFKKGSIPGTVNHGVMGLIGESTAAALVNTHVANYLLNIYVCTHRPMQLSIFKASSAVGIS